MIAIILLLVFGAVSPAVQQQIDLIDQQIETLTEEKNSKEAEAARAEDEGMQWEFQSDQQMDARQAFEREDAARARVQEIEAQIEALERKKAGLLDGADKGS